MPRRASTRVGTFGAGKDTWPQSTKPALAEKGATPPTHATFGCPSCTLLCKSADRSHARDQPPPPHLQPPSAGEKQDPQSNQPQRAANLVEDVAEIEPPHRNSEAHNPEVDQRSARHPHAQPDQEDCERCDQHVRHQVRTIKCHAGLDAVANVEVLHPVALTPWQRDRRSHRRCWWYKALVSLERGHRERQPGDGAPAPNARAEGHKCWSSIPGTPPLQHEDDADDGRNGGSAEQDAPHHLPPRTQEECYVKDGPYKQEPPQIRRLADLVLGGVRQLREDPRRHQQQRQRLLGFVVQ